MVESITLPFLPMMRKGTTWRKRMVVIPSPPEIIEIGLDLCPRLLIHISSGVHYLIFVDCNGYLLMRASFFFFRAQHVK